MPKRRDEKAVLDELEKKRQAIEARIRATRTELAARQARARATERAAHERRMWAVIRTFSFEGVSPERLEAALREAGLQRRGATAASEAAARQAARL